MNERKPFQVMMFFKNSQVSSRLIAAVALAAPILANSQTVQSTATSRPTTTITAQTNMPASVQPKSQVTAQTKADGVYKVGDRLDPKAPTPPRGGFKEIRWEDLSPKDWDPFASIRDLNFATLKDNDPKAIEALQKLTEARNQAPVVQALQGQAIRLSGFIIPTNKIRDDVVEFLLVPYFGACIHTPPPPSNMVILVSTDKPYKGGVTMDTVTVNGVITIDRSESPWGVAGYKIDARQVVKYEAPKR
jgi:uncharacterized protein